MPVQHRPELHVTAETGVLNAPAGVLRDGDTWHVFYQFQPKLGAPCRWGHVISDDNPFTWTECDDVLAPVGGETAVRAGSVQARDGGADLYFTSVTSAGTKVQVAHMDVISDVCEVSDDPSTLDPSVRRIAEIVTDRGGYSNFRSPCVVRGWEKDHDRDAGHEGWLMLAVTGTVDEPRPVVLTSPDARDWTIVGPLSFSGEHGLAEDEHIVSPRIIRLRDRVSGDIFDVLLVTLERDGRDVSGYLVGELKGSEFTVTTGFTRIDSGHDFTRPRTAYSTADPDDDGTLYDDAVIFGLMNGIGRTDDASTHLSLERSDWANVLSLPRVLTLQDGRIFQTPFPGVLDAVAASSRARSWIGMCEIPSGSEVSVDVVDDSGQVACTVRHTGDELIVDRSMNPYHAGDEPVRAELSDADTDSLSIIVDGSTVEVFADGGQVAMASRVYVKGGEPSYDVTASGGATIERSFEHSTRTRHADLLADLEIIEDEL